MSELDKEFLISELYRNLLEGDVKVVDWSAPKPRFMWSIWETVKNMFFKIEPMRTYYRIIWKISDDEIYNLTVEPAMGTHVLIHDLAFAWSTILKRNRAKGKKNV